MALKKVTRLHTQGRYTGSSCSLEIRQSSQSSCLRRRHPLHPQASSQLQPEGGAPRGGRSLRSNTSPQVPAPAHLCCDRVTGPRPPPHRGARGLDSTSSQTPVLRRLAADGRRPGLSPPVHPRPLTGSRTRTCSCTAHPNPPQRVQDSPGRCFRYQQRLIFRYLTPSGTFGGQGALAVPLRGTKQAQNPATIWPSLGLESGVPDAVQFGNTQRRNTSGSVCRGLQRESYPQHSDAEWRLRG